MRKISWQIISVCVVKRFVIFENLDSVLEKGLLVIIWNGFARTYFLCGPSVNGIQKVQIYSKVGTPHHYVLIETE